MKKTAYANHCRALVPEGLVLLETDGALPLKEKENVAVFGRGQFEYLKSGTGSGGRVNCPYVTTIADEIEKRVTVDREVRDFYYEYIQTHPFDTGDGWIQPTSQAQPSLDEAFVKAVAARNEKAIYVLCRVCGEGVDCKPEKGNWYLSDEEEKSIAALCKHFKHVIVLVNSGNLIDMNWVKKYGVGTVLYIWQGGQEGGLATVDALMGDVTPSGKLPDTIPTEIESHPSNDCFGDALENIHKEDIYVGYRYFETFAREQVLYPFGFGRSYTTFEMQTLKAEKTATTVELTVRVKNVGAFSGKEVAQVYYSAPQGTLGRPARELIAFQKTETLQPNEEALLRFSIAIADMAAYDDSGKSGYPFSWITEAGEYAVYVGSDVRTAEKVCAFRLEKTELVKACKQALVPQKAFEKMTTKDGKTVCFEPATLRQYDLAQRIAENMPAEIPYTGDRGITLRDVAAGKQDLKAFIAQFDDDALGYMALGEGMSSFKAPTPGTTGCFGGCTPVWNEKGVPVISTCDGPSGLRLENPAKVTCIPSGSLLASTWNPELFEGVFGGFAEEMKQYYVDVILAPGINIHRSPLGGRNFEYFSEDPYLTGRCAAKVAEYFTNKGVYCTLKHFAVNSQEIGRHEENEVLSERALREIYLKPFEIAVKSGYVYSIMTSYNRVNGLATASSYDLTTTILREEWGYQGFVMTDWWSRMDDPNKGTHDATNIASMVKAQNDVFMLTPDAVQYACDTKEALQNGYLTRAELQRCVENLLKFTQKTDAFRANRKDNLTSEPLAGALVLEAVAKEKRMELHLPKEGYYCCELVYRIDGDPLAQKKLIFSLGETRDPLLFVVGSTEGKLMKRRFLGYLEERTLVRVIDEYIVGLNVYEKV